MPRYGYANFIRHLQAATAGKALFVQKHHHVSIQLLSEVGRHSFIVWQIALKHLAIKVWQRQCAKFCTAKVPQALRKKDDQRYPGNSQSENKKIGQDASNRDRYPKLLERAWRANTATINHFPFAG